MYPLGGTNVPSDVEFSFAMNNQFRYDSRYSNPATSGYSKVTSTRPPSSESDDCIIVTSPRNRVVREKRRRPDWDDRPRSLANNGKSVDDIAGNLRLVDCCTLLLGERPEFCRNGASQDLQVRSNNHSRDVSGMGHSKRRRSDDRHRKTHSDKHSKQSSTTLERRVLITAGSDRTQSRRKKKKSTAYSWESSVTTRESKKRRKRRRSPSSSSSSSSSSSCSSSSDSDTSSRSSSSSSGYERRKRRKKRKAMLAKKIRREEKRRRLDKRKENKTKEKKPEVKTKAPVKLSARALSAAEHDRLLNDINMELAERARAMAPMTKTQWEKKQSVVRRVTDEETGRKRLIKGDGEVLEEIVSRKRHTEINKKATKGDGKYFQSRLRVPK